MQNNYIIQIDGFEFYFVNPLVDEDIPELVYFQRGDKIMVRKKWKPEFLESTLDDGENFRLSQ